VGQDREEEVEKNGHKKARKGTKRRISPRITPDAEQARIAPDQIEEELILFLF
jgi:hypothetical protein